MKENATHNSTDETKQAQQKHYQSLWRETFTLIELLITIAIIGILLSMLLPALKKARDAAKSTCCLSNLKQLGAGLISYADDHDGFLPQTTYSPKRNNNWPIRIASYTGYKWQTGPAIHACPSDPYDYNNNRKISYGWNYDLYRNGAQALRISQFLTGIPLLLEAGQPYPSVAGSFIDQYDLGPDSTTLRLIYTNSSSYEHPVTNAGWCFNSASRHGPRFFNILMIGGNAMKTKQMIQSFNGEDVIWDWVPATRTYRLNGTIHSY